VTSEATGPHVRSLEMSGLEHLEAIRDGAIPPPPIAELMGFDLVEVGHGRATFAVEPVEKHYNPIGVVHGGLAATLLDSAMGCAVPEHPRRAWATPRSTSTPPFSGR
jgi:acyl-coenzyme A thioesterase PaaI-like protein